MTREGLRIAEQISFETFVNCYLREQDSGTWHTVREWRERVDPAWQGQGAWVLELGLPCQGMSLAFDVTYRSLVGRHSIGLVRSEVSSHDWRAGDSLQVVFFLVRELYSRTTVRDLDARANELELVSRIVQSQQIMSRYVQERAHDQSLDSDRFIDSEQSLLYGHCAHPTPKSRQGMTDWQHESYAPELCGSFQLHFFAVNRALIRQRSVLGRTAEEIISSTLAGDPQAMGATAIARERGEVLVPVHPLQVDWLRHQEHVLRWLEQRSVRDIGRLGPRFCATSSVRTVYSAECDFMFKLSIPVRITNSLRANRRHELFAGLAMSQLLGKLDGSTTRVDIILDPAYLTLECPGGGESGFELLLRANPFRRGLDRGVHCVGAIVQAPLPHRVSRLRRLLEGLALTEGRSERAVSVDWLARYVSCAIEPLIRIYDEHGIALEAHQQNTLLDVTAGYPRRCYFRDNQGFYLSSAHRGRLLLAEPELIHRPELFFEDDIIQRRFSYYLVSNQLFSVVHRLGRDGLLDEESSLALIKARFRTFAEELTGCGRQLVEALLEARGLPHKANLLTRARDLDELELDAAVYVELENPFRFAPGSGALELEVA